MRLDGAVLLPVYRARTLGIISNLRVSRKSVDKFGEPIGTITKDLKAAIVGKLGDPPDMIPISVSYDPANRTTPIMKEAQVAYSQEWAIASVVALTSRFTSARAYTRHIRWNIGAIV